ncbi:MAG: hypothetical protein FJ115_00530 [Deltaproteobacteria bacterium]|nr:hypothetical protein [Deltaproteobacteria bacterium]MBM4322016.1 hypothetical protein [Deltaproteobacteria bacterium]
MEMDIPLTYFYECPICGYRGLFSAGPTAYVKCICGRRWVIGDYEYYLSLSREEREKIRTWDINFYKDQRELNYDRTDMAVAYS